MPNRKGALYVACFRADATGRWFPMKLTTPTNPNQASQISAVKFPALDEAQHNTLVKLFRRIGVASSTIEGDAFNCDRTNEGTVLQD
ncbi:hypothetical protein [Calothrix sp. PCC 6303]|uniref:hypothetical protein n=1 Tax=Calothrix sp. PCC 6303 TaxID=1170562 RepID=UPI00030CFA03|nr:hypothetical protein [Calothrix sp. PCC 6303]